MDGGKKTDKISYGGVASSDVSYTCVFNNLPNGLQTHCRAPMGVDIRDKWTVNGSLPGERPEMVEIGLGAPATGLYLREDVDLRCNVLMASFVKKTLKKSHATLVEKLAAKAQMVAAEERGRLRAGQADPRSSYSSQQQQQQQQHHHHHQQQQHMSVPHNNIHQRSTSQPGYRTARMHSRTPSPESYNPGLGITTTAHHHPAARHEPVYGYQQPQQQQQRRPQQQQRPEPYRAQVLSAGHEPDLIPEPLRVSSRPASHKSPAPSTSARSTTASHSPVPSLVSSVSTVSTVSTRSSARSTPPTLYINTNVGHGRTVSWQAPPLRAYADHLQQAAHHNNPPRPHSHPRMQPPSAHHQQVAQGYFSPPKAQPPPPPQQQGAYFSPPRVQPPVFFSPPARTTQQHHHQQQLPPQGFHTQPKIRSAQPFQTPAQTRAPQPQTYQALPPPQRQQQQQPPPLLNAAQQPRQQPQPAYIVSPPSTLSAYHRSPPAGVSPMPPPTANITQGFRPSQASGGGASQPTTTVAARTASATVPRIVEQKSWSTEYPVMNPYADDDADEGTEFVPPAAEPKDLPVFAELAGSEAVVVQPMDTVLRSGSAYPGISASLKGPWQADIM